MLPGATVHQKASLLSVVSLVLSNRHVHDLLREWGFLELLEIEQGKGG